MKFRLPSSVSSTQDIADIVLELQDYARWLSRVAILERTNSKHIPETPALSPAALELVRTWCDGNKPNRQNIESLIKTVEEFRTNAPSMTITLAAPITSVLEKTLVDWCRNNIEPNIMVTFQFNSSILGGLVVRYRSRIYDWSFRRQLLNSRYKFPEVLRRV